MALSGLKTMAAEAFRDRVTAFAAALVALVLLLSAWPLAVATVVILLAERIGTAAALAVAAGTMIAAAGLVLAVSAARNRRAKERRAATRALWAATAVTAIDALTKGDGTGAGRGHRFFTRTTVLLAGAVAMLFLALLSPPGGDGDPPRDADS